MRRTLRLLVIAMLVGISALPWAWARDSASAQVLPRGREQAATGQFTGPTYGVSVAYTDAWEVSASGSTGSVDYLKLGNGVSAVDFYVGPGSGSLVDCVDETATWVRDNSFSDLVYADLVVDSDTEFGAVFSAVNGEITAVISCRDFGHPEAQLLFMWMFRTSAAASQAPLIEELLNGVSV